MANITPGQLFGFMPYGPASAQSAPMSSVPLVTWRGWAGRFIGNLLDTGGDKSISGRTYESGAPVSRRVLILTQPPHAKIIYESDTLPPGATFVFPFLAPGNYTVLDMTFDGSEQALIYDWVIPV